MHAATKAIGMTILAALPAIGAGEPAFQQHAIDAKSPFEAAGALDVDGDGKLDVVCGERWFKGPEFRQSFPVREVQKVGTYYNCFANLPYDVNADGKMDYVTVSYFGKNVGWVENPGAAGKPWTYHEIDLPGTSEAAWAIDLTGDGRPEVLPNPTNVVVFYELKNPGPNATWKKYDFGTEAAGHGVGTGDINADGRLDLLTPKGWFEAPENPAEGKWAWHPEWDLGATGIQILGRDVTGDGRTDVMWGMGHNRGFYWIEQGEPSADGRRTWGKPQVIDDKPSSVHTQLWADLNGDGKDDELITGKRVYAHEVEPGDVEASIVAYYRYDPKAKKWDRHVIFEGSPATPPADPKDRDAQKDFPPGTAGTGLQMTATDLDGDGDVDLLCPGKSGLYWFENLGSKP